MGSAIYEKSHHFRRLLSGRCCYRLAGAKHVAVIVHVIVRHEQLVCKSLVAEEAADALGDIVEHVQLLDEVLGKCIFAVPLAAVALTER